MQNTFKAIFELAKKEVPHKLVLYKEEQFIIFRGFKTGFKNNRYIWKDVRDDNFYEDVDPTITEKVLELGFDKTLQMVLIHDDKNKMLLLKRKIIRINIELKHWAQLSLDIWGQYKKEAALLKKNLIFSKDVLELKRAYFMAVYEKKKSLYNKERKLLKDHRDEIMSDLDFYSSRIKSFGE